MTRNDKMKCLIETSYTDRTTRGRAIKKLALDALETDKPEQTLRDMPTPDNNTVAKMMLSPSVYRRSNQGRNGLYRGKTWAQHFDDMRQTAVITIGMAKYAVRYGA